ncbi:sugar phosphate isomerase/epimerase family protein [Desulfosediminicola sp.]|uniref:sugar phosphate isomerase/epimerase family protein n=1 Tax=Desulfosediminicola sp. TaxID=2886825 RepID=UPI003AF2CA8C
MLKLAIITGFLSQTKDRFHEYNTPLSVDEKFRMLSEIPGYNGVEIVYPYEVNDVQATRESLKKYDLRVAAVNVNVKAEPEFRNGGLTSPDPAIREKAVRLIKESKDFAAEIGADKVTCCPLGDGYEFAFQYDYAASWKNLIDTFSEAGDYRRDIPLFIEYKPSETRGRCFIDTAAKALCLLNDMKIEEMGVTLDFGHSMYGNENPAEAVALLQASPYRYYIHINDNDGRWDWDYFCGTKHFIDYVEFLYYLKKYDYTDFFTSDTSPTRWDIRGTFEANSRMTQKIWNLFEAVDTNELEKLMGAGDYLETWKFVESNFLGLK